MPMITDQSLESFLIENQDRFYRLAYSYLKHPEDAMDAVQTAVCRAVARQSGLRNPGALRSWFYHILVNTCLDALRQRGRTLPLSEWEETGREDPPPEDEDLLRQIDGLPPAVGAVIRLRFFEELSLKEIAAATGTNVNTVKSRLYAGLKKLRIAMEGENIE